MRMGIETVLPRFLEFCEGAVMVAHNAGFDMGFISQKSSDLGLDCKFTIVDTVSVARALLPELKNYKLHTVAKQLNVSLEHHHRAVDDAEATAEIFLHMNQAVGRQGDQESDTVKRGLYSE